MNTKAIESNKQKQATNSNQQKQTVIFLHIPKTAGSTLNKIIERQYKKKETLTTDSIKVVEFMQSFKDFPLEKLEKIRLVRGHMYFGLDRYLPNSATYITILREPVDRVISLYYYILRREGHNNHQQAKSVKDLKDYLYTVKSKQLNNCQTRLLAGMDFLDVEFGDNSREMLAAAKDNLSKYFSVVGTTSRFDETLVLMQQKLGWNLPLYAKKNVTNKRPKKASMSQDTLNTIVALNQLDIELYEYAELMLDELIARQPNSWQKEVEKFQSYNKVLGNPYHIFHKIITLDLSNELFVK